MLTLIVTVTELETEEYHDYRMDIPADTSGSVCAMLAKGLAFDNSWTPGSVDIYWQTVEKDNPRMPKSPTHWEPVEKDDKPVSFLRGLASLIEMNRRERVGNADSGVLLARINDTTAAQLLAHGFDCGDAMAACAELGLLDE